MREVFLEAVLEKRDTTGANGNFADRQSGSIGLSLAKIQICDDSRIAPLCAGFRKAKAVNVNGMAFPGKDNQGRY